MNTPDSPNCTMKYKDHKTVQLIEASHVAMMETIALTNQFIYKIIAPIKAAGIVHEREDEANVAIEVIFKAWEKAMSQLDTPEFETLTKQCYVLVKEYEAIWPEACFIRCLQEAVAMMTINTLAMLFVCWNGFLDIVNAAGCNAVCIKRTLSDGLDIYKPGLDVDFMSAHAAKNMAAAEKLFAYARAEGQSVKDAFEYAKNERDHTRSESKSIKANPYALDDLPTMDHNPPGGG